MGAGRIQLSAIGPQDLHLTANPQITFFKTVFKRHTNFSKEVRRLYFRGEQKPDFGLEDVRLDVKNEGDLLGNIFLEIKINGTTTEIARTVSNFTNSLFDKVECLVGGYKIDTHYGRFYQIIDELEGRVENDIQNSSDSSYGGKYVSIDRTADLSQTREVVNNYARQTGNYTLSFRGNQSGATNISSAGTYTKIFYYPLKFWFNKDPGLYFPMVSLFRHNMEIMFNFTSKNKLLGNSDTSGLDMTIEMKAFGEFYYLDSSEKTRFAQSNHEYLIEQAQINQNLFVIPSTTESSFETTKINIPLNFSHPVKYMTWVVVNEGISGENAGQGPCYFVSLTRNSLYGNDGDKGTVELTLEGVTREIEMPMIYYTRVNPNTYCKSTPDLDRIGFYSFALNPLSNEPSGTCNFSKLNNKEIKLVLANNNISNISNKNLYIYAVNYNVLTFTNGMAAVRYT